jgi:peptidoglycan hydrolase CwlO-like protein
VPKNPPKDYFASMIAPGTKKIAITMKRIGAKERLVQIAVCMDERMADRIVEALNLHQGELDKVDNKMQGLVDDLRSHRARDQKLIVDLRLDANSSKHEASRLKEELRRVTEDLRAAKKEVAANSAAARQASSDATRALMKG